MSNEAYNFYGYYPNLGAGIFFVVAFSIVSIILSYQIIYYKFPLYITILVGLLVEIAGWVSRAISHNDPYALNPYLVQEICLILAPCFISAGIYATMDLLSRYVKGVSILKPKLYLALFCSADVIALFIQGAGGGLAATGSSSSAQTQSLGINIVLGGIAFQLVTTFFFVVLELVFVYRAYKQGKLFSQSSDKPLSRIASMTLIASLFILIRCVYRVVELSQGPEGDIVRHEAPFDIFDALAMLLTGVTCVVLFPGYLLKRVTDATYLYLNTSPQTMEHVGFGLNNETSWHDRSTETIIKM